MGVTYSLAVDGGMAYVAGNAGVAIVDVGNPARPELVGTVPTPDTPFGVAVAGGIAYIAAGEGGLIVADAQDPRAPRTLAHLELSGVATRLSLEGSRL